MFKQHKKAIELITDNLSQKDEILGIIVGGSVAHGFASETSDIDLMLVLSEADYKTAFNIGNILYKDTESTNYKEGYIDGKYTCLSYIRKVAESGSEPARYAFKDAFVTYSKIPELEDLIKKASRYPNDKKMENLEKFHAQFEAWKWMYYEGLKRNNNYVIDFSVINFVLFAGRLILALNETLYPYHKWFLRVLEGLENKPEDLMNIIDNVLKNKTQDSVEALYECIHKFHNFPQYERGWHARFMLDSELNWMSGYVPVPDL
ncbi:nucleotidyltransferase domain-containing protein [Peribacillus muralis]|uniref:nucleotidyltransferase domain-containing protein n=1 Tax=Peribacillus muralis TaxID=264697 RepID=UPI001F4D4CB2|nr:nucleotidyltransferase domain-containing protein [Peribacillus muralis]MCK1994743.1 nucleotidyltransferase domain-containing protein [Peribacillus muralis]MCK2015430.1 nucleotidyltransferase domain-containing protein [Peribacillus muralis]